MAADAADYKKGARFAFRHTFGVRVDGATPRGLWPPVGDGLCSLRSGGDSPDGLRVAVSASPQIIKVSVTGLASGVIWHDKHSGDWLAALATPYPGCAGLPPMQGAE